MPRATKNVINNNYFSNGVIINPAVPSVGEKVKLTYDGLLSKSGATHVFAHVGYGNKWDNAYDYQMTKTSMGFETTIPIIKSDTMNLCFKDCASNWDNNSGMNYSFDIS